MAISRWLGPFGVLALMAVLFGVDGGLVTAQQPNQNYQFKSMRLDDGERLVLRLNQKSGETWANHTSTPTAWVKVTDDGVPPEGNYEIILLEGKEKGGWWAMRADRKSGRAWHLTTGKWVEIRLAK
jgi:hypothetical protein